MPQNEDWEDDITGPLTISSILALYPELSRDLAMGSISIQYIQMEHEDFYLALYSHYEEAIHQHHQLSSEEDEYTFIYDQFRSDPEVQKWLTD